MADKLVVLKLAKDIIRGKVNCNFADASKNSEALVKQLVELNGGKQIDIKTFHRGNPMFEIIEEIIPIIVHEGLTGDEFFFNLVDYRNLQLGDDIDFWTEDKTEFIVADAAYGTQGIRRQRLGAMEKYNVKTTLKVIKVYEELKRLMASRVDFQTFITKASQAMINAIRQDIYTIFSGVTATTHGLNSTYVRSGSYNEDTLLELVDHVEASNSAPAVIMGTKSSLRKVGTAVLSKEAKSDLYHMGYYGKFNGTNMIYLPQRHKVGTDAFLLDNNKLYVFAGSDKPIKSVNVGEGILSISDPLQTADHTQNYLYGQEVGVGLVFNSKQGFYTLS